MNNRDLRTTYENISYVIVADRDGCRKYVSRHFPGLFQYTVKLDQAKRFRCTEDAEKFLEWYSSSPSHIVNPVIHKCIRTFTLEG